MSNSQKVIKYFAYILAIYIICLIVYSIGSILNITTNIFFKNNDSNISENTKVISNENSLDSLDIDIKYSNIEIIKSDTFKVETNNDYIKYNYQNNRVSIVENKHNNYKSYLNKSVLKVFLPDKSLKDVKIENGAGRLTIDSFTTDKLNLSLGAGNVDISNIIVNSKISIEGGAGNIKIKNSTLNNLNLSTGVGNINIKANILGNSNIDAGIGNIDIKLTDGIDNYQFDIDKGLGNILIDGIKQKDDTKYGMGHNNIDIDGGVGNISID